MCLFSRGFKRSYRYPLRTGLQRLSPEDKGKIQKQTQAPQRVAKMHRCVAFVLRVHPYTSNREDVTISSDGKTQPSKVLLHPCTAQPNPDDIWYDQTTNTCREIDHGSMGPEQPCDSTESTRVSLLAPSEQPAGYALFLPSQDGPFGRSACPPISGELLERKRWAVPEWMPASCTFHGQTSSQSENCGHFCTAGLPTSFLQLDISVSKPPSPWTISALRLFTAQRCSVENEEQRIRALSCSDECPRNKGQNTSVSCALFSEGQAG